MYEIVCDICGHTIINIMIGCEIEGEYVDYINHQKGDITLYICEECWRKMCEISHWNVKKSKEVFNEEINNGL